VTHLVLGGAVSFAESIDPSRSTSARSRRPSSSASPHLRKAPAGFLFKLGESGGCVSASSGPASPGKEIVGPPAGRDRRLLDRLGYALLYVLLSAISSAISACRSRHRLCAGASISPETLRFFDIVGRPVSQGYGLTESGGVAFIQTERHHRLGGCGLPCSTPSEARQRWRDPAAKSGSSRAIFSTRRPRPQRSIPAAGCGPATSLRSWIMARSPWSIAEGDHITAGGKNIAPSEIENALKDSEFIKEAIVVGEAKNISARSSRSTSTMSAAGHATRSCLHELQVAVAACRGARVGRARRQRNNKRFARVENIRRSPLEKNLITTTAN